MSIFKTIFFITGVFLCVVTNAQSLNDYQYVIVPKQFDFQKQPHDYDMNRMVQFKLNQLDFVAFIEGEKLLNDFSICDALKASVVDKGFINTNLILTLKDCNGNVVYTSLKGKSVKKEYKIAYYEAIRKVFNDYQLKSHKYNGEKTSRKLTIPRVVAQPRPVKPIIEEPELLTGKRITKTPAKPSGPSLLFVLRDKQYTFTPQGNNYLISQSGKIIGQATLNSETNNYIIKAGSLSGTGIFDDYGNFELNRVNPVTQKSIKDILARVE